MTPEYIVPNCFRGHQELIALQSTRKGGASNGVYSSLNLGSNTGDRRDLVYENTRRLCVAAGINPGQLVSSDQVHGTEILYAEKPGRYHGYDSLVTDKNNLFLCIFTADCYPVLIYDPRHNASGAIHAGWKGSAGQIVSKTIATMVVRFSSIPAECLAFIGTGISANAYEVDKEVAKEFPPDTSKRCTYSPDEEKYLLDLGLVNYRQLLSSGITASNIERSPFCSYGDKDLFFSYRRDQGKTGRMVSLIGVGQR
jgi:YfiH family protein